MQFCVRCGARVFPDADFCTHCGERIDPPESNVYVFALAEDERDPNYSIDFFEAELVGVSRFEDEFDKILGHVEDDEEAEEDDVTAVLIREEESSRPERISVHVWDGANAYRQVGYLSSNDAAEYAEVVEELERRTGRIVGCLAKVHVQGPTDTCDWSTYSARVYLPDAQSWLDWRI